MSRPALSDEEREWMAILDAFKEQNPNCKVTDFISGSYKAGDYTYSTVTIWSRPKQPTLTVGDIVCFNTNPVGSNRGEIKHIDGDMAWVRWHDGPTHSVTYLDQLEAIKAAERAEQEEK